MLKRWLGLLAAGAILLLAGLSPASGEVAVPPLRAHVTDLTGTLSAQQIQDLDSRLREFERAKGSQIAVLMLPSTEPETIEQYSIRVADAWKIGRARVDDGVILVVAKNDRKLRVEVGRGLEGAIPDAIAKRVVSDVIAPHFRSGDFYGGIAAGTDALMKVIEGEPLPAPPAASGGFGREFDFLTIVVLIAALVMFGFFAVLFVQAAGGPRGRRWSSGPGGGWSTGGWSGGDSGGGGFGGGGGFSGGGGGFGGGGASGSW
jgi:uncharacterized protein